VINGKFLAGATTITILVVSIVLVISGFGLTLIGVVPGVEEILRLAIYVGISIFYISFWLGLSILFSIVFRSVATSFLASVALWIFLSFFVSLGASVLANSIAPVEKKEGAEPETIVTNSEIKEEASLLSPMFIYSSATATIVDPMRKTTRSLVLMGPMEQLSSSRFQNPLSLGQSLVVVYPQLVALIAISLICFAVSYWIFMMQEIRT
jgi:ABC-2 type transport system permease protein